MELLKLDDRVEEYKYKDVVFYFRTTVSSGDKFNVDISGSMHEDGKIHYKPMEFYRTIIKTFVTGWRGVTENGKEISYSFETLATRFPADPTEDLFIKLGLHIAEKTGIYSTKKKEEPEIKNG
jgi:hypothetical protein